jgi:hypothetical protein
MRLCHPSVQIGFPGSIASSFCHFTGEICPEASRSILFVWQSALPCGPETAKAKRNTRVSPRFVGYYREIVRISWSFRPYFGFLGYFPLLFSFLSFVWLAELPGCGWIGERRLYAAGYRATLARRGTAAQKLVA